MNNRTSTSGGDNVVLFLWIGKRVYKIGAMARLAKEEAQIVDG